MINLRSRYSDLYLVMINVSISCDHDAFLNSCFRYPTFYSLEVTKEKGGGLAITKTHLHVTRENTNGAHRDLLITIRQLTLSGEH